MINNNCSILFYCRKGQCSKKGQAKIEMSLNYCGKRFFISLPRKENPKIFKLCINSKKDNDIKDFCKLYEEKTKEYILQQLKLGKQIEKEELKKYFHYGFKDYTSIGDIATEFLTLQKKKQNADEITSGTLRQTNVTINHLISFFGNDKDINEIRENDIELFKIELEKTHKKGTIIRYISYAKTMFRYAQKNGVILTNPCDNIKVSTKNVEIRDKFLTNDEIELIKKTDCGKYNDTKDCFIFQIYTGLSYSDYYKLTKDDIQKGTKGYFIRDKRKKTGIEYTIPLIDDAIRILEKYDFELPKWELRTYDNRLKKIKEICGIKKKISSHVGRHTAATYLLNNGIPKEIVQKILGHSQIKQTETYAKMLDESVMDEMQGFEEKREEKRKKDLDLQNKFKMKEDIRKALKRLMETRNDDEQLTEDEIEQILQDNIFNGSTERDFLEQQFQNGEITEDEFKQRLKDIENR